MSKARSTPGALRVRVPGSTSNLGPGFDCLGLALSLFLDVECRPTQGSEHNLGPCTGEAAGWPMGKENLLVQAFERSLGLFNVETPCGFELRAHSEIPVGRGIGSSGAALAAGICLARAVATQDLHSEPDQSMLELALQMDGHPDNGTASLLGGCTLAVPCSDRMRVLRPPIHSELGFALAWPSQALPTAEARQALPERVPHTDAAENPRRLALLLEGLRTGHGDWIREGFQERLHIQYRLPLIPGSAQALALAVEAGAYSATLSGAGSGLVAVGPIEAMEPIAEAMAIGLSAGDSRAQGIVAQPVQGSPQVERLN